MFDSVNNSFSYNVNAVSGTLRKSHHKSKFCVRVISDSQFIFDDQEPCLTKFDKELIILQIMLTGENKALIEYVLKEDFEEIVGEK